MITCGKCNFEISEKMKFAIIKNVCPSCGVSILEESSSQELEQLSKLIQKKSFVSELSVSEEQKISLSMDMAMFIVFDIKKIFEEMQNGGNPLPPISKAYNYQEKEQFKESFENDDVDDDDDVDLQNIPDDEKEIVRNMISVNDSAKIRKLKQTAYSGLKRLPSPIRRVGDS